MRSTPCFSVLAAWAPSGPDAAPGRRATAPNSVTQMRKPGRLRAAGCCFAVRGALRPAVASPPTAAVKAPSFLPAAAPVCRIRRTAAMAFAIVKHSRYFSELTAATRQTTVAGKNEAHVRVEWATTSRWRVLAYARWVVGGAAIAASMDLGGVGAGILNWPRGPMDKASAYGAGGCRFKSCRGHFLMTERPNADRDENAGKGGSCPRR